MSHAPTNFAGLHVAAFESRRAEEMARLIEKHGGRPCVGPAMREVPVEKNAAAIDFAHRVMTGQCDVVIFMTGVGVKMLMQQIERHVDAPRFLKCLSDITTIARGPKPVAALKGLGIDPTRRVPEPNTWREVLQTLDQHGNVANQRVVIQEYGLPNASLVAGLEARGAQVTSLKVYVWDLPEDRGPLERTVRSLAEGKIDVALFTSQHQLVNLMLCARDLGLESDVRRGLNRAVIGSIGPTTTEGIHEHDLHVDFEPQHAKMGHLVQEAAERSGALLAAKRSAGVNQLPSPAGRGEGASLPAWHNSLFLKACRREPTPRTPIWLMRQAGRYLPEYRAIRERTPFLEFCKNSQLAADVMIATVERLGVDAAIIFSDLLPILEPMGMQLEYSAGEGPIIHNPLRTADDIDRLRELEDLGPLDFVMQTVRRTRAGLPGDIPVIGFAGAPFTLASYAVEGGSSRHYLHAKSLMYRDAGAWRAMMEQLARGITRYLTAQINAGAQAVQLFDSWVGCLGPEDYRQHVLPFTKMVFDGLPRGVPAIHFATGNPALLPLLAEAGGTVIGIDWRIELADAWRTVGYDRAVQGNLDPVVLLSDRNEIRRRARAILNQAAGRPGHIFNLGHGVLPQTPVENVLALIEAVKEYKHA